MVKNREKVREDRNVPRDQVTMPIASPKVVMATAFDKPRRLFYFVSSLVSGVDKCKGLKYFILLTFFLQFARLIYALLSLVSIQNMYKLKLLKKVIAFVFVFLLLPSINF